MTENSQRLSDIEALEGFVVDNHELALLEARVDQFNIFEAIGVVKQELRHSDFLAFLLDPQQPHGLGDIFLKSLLQKVLIAARGLQMPMNLVDLDVWSLEETEVFREWRNIDILLRNESKQVAVIVENKVQSGEGDDQLKRYYEQVMHEFPEWKIIALFLTPDGTEPSYDRYLPISYRLIAEQLKEMLTRRASSIGPDVRILITHYTEMLGRHIMSGSDIDELCRLIYQKHQRALDLIFERRVDLQSKMKEELLAMVSMTPGMVPDHSSKSYIRFTCHGLDECVPKNAQGWTPSGRALLFELINDSDRLRLVMVLGPGPADMRQSLLNVARSNTPPFRVTAKTITPMYTRIYSQNILSTREYEQADLSTLMEKVQGHWRHFVEDDLPRIVEAVRKGFDKGPFESS